MITVKTVYIQPQPVFKTKLPQEAKFLGVSNIGDIPQMLFLVDMIRAEEERNFMYTLPGRRIDFDQEKLVFLGTFEQRLKPYALFEVKP